MSYMRILFILIFLVSGFAQAQNCSKYLQRESSMKGNFIDDLTIHTKEIVYSQPTIIDTRAASFRVMDGKRFYFHLSSGNSRDLIYGSDVIVTFDDDYELLLRIEQKDRIMVGTESVTHANCRVYKKEDVKKFYTHKVKKIKLMGTKQEFIFTKKEKTKLQYCAHCIIDKVGLDNVNYDSERKTKLIPDLSGASFDVSSSSMVIMAGSIKCNFAVDSLDAKGKPYRESETKSIVSSPFELQAKIEQSNGEIWLNLTYQKDLGCVNKDSYIIFKFKDETTKKFNHQGKDDCSEIPVFRMNVTHYKEDFWMREMEVIRISYSEYYADLGVSNPTWLGSFLRYCFE